MKLLFLTLKFACLVGVLGTKHKPSAVPAKRYRVNLDDPPTQRWIPVLQHFPRSTVLAAYQTLEDSFIHNDALKHVIAVIAGDLNKYIPQPYADEMKGMADYYGIPLGQVVLPNIGYELTAWNRSGFKACTSIIAMDKDGCVIHGKNTDYHVASDILRNVSADVEFFRNGKVEFIASTFVGALGVMMAAKPSKFAIALNQRLYGVVWENILAAFEKHWPTAFWLREVMANAIDYEDALEMLSQEKTISPFYAIASGMKPQEGAIVVGDRWGSCGVIRMKDFDEGWFIVQTNYDPWTKPPASDNRRDPAIKFMKSYGEMNTTLDTMYKVLSTPPVFSYKTIFTTLISSQNISTYKTMLRYDRPNKL